MKESHFSKSLLFPPCLLSLFSLSNMQKSTFKLQKRGSRNIKGKESFVGIESGETVKCGNALTTGANWHIIRQFPWTYILKLNTTAAPSRSGKHSQYYYRHLDKATWVRIKGNSPARVEPKPPPKFLRSISTPKKEFRRTYSYNKKYKMWLFTSVGKYLIISNADWPSAIL